MISEGNKTLYQARHVLFTVNLEFAMFSLHCNWVPNGFITGMGGWEPVMSYIIAMGPLYDFITGMRAIYGFIIEGDL